MPEQPESSPTGTPRIPQRFVPYVFGLVAFAGILRPMLPEGSPYARACEVVVGLGAAFGIVSQGWRKGAATPGLSRKE